jgi:hypothetical protein
VNASFDGWILRRRAQVFRGSTTKIAQFVAVLFARGALLVLAAWLYFVLVFLHQFYPNSVPGWADRWLGEELEAFPRLTFVSWVAILLVVLNLWVTLFALRRGFSRKERTSASNP